MNDWLIAWLNEWYIDWISVQLIDWFITCIAPWLDSCWPGHRADPTEPKYRQSRVPFPASAAAGKFSRHTETAYTLWPSARCPTAPRSHPGHNQSDTGWAASRDPMGTPGSTGCFPSAQGTTPRPSPAAPTSSAPLLRPAGLDRRRPSGTGGRGPRCRTRTWIRPRI